MEAQIAQFTNRGMNQDISVSKATNEFAFENYNIRITAVNDNTLLSITNEKLPKNIPVEIIKTGLKNNKICYISGGGIYSEYLVASNITIRVHSVWAETGEKKYDDVIISEGTSFVPLSLKYSIFESIEILYDSTDDVYAYYIEGEEEPSYQEETYNTIFGIYKGHCIINNYLILFTHSEESYIDYIYKLHYDNKSLKGVLKYKGDLGLINNVEVLPYYESEDIQKVYWVDGIHQPRMINIAGNTTLNNYSTHLEFSPSISKSPEINIVKEYNGYGVFPAGVIQYFISYYDKFGAETNIIKASELYSISTNKAGSPEDIINCEFNISITNIDNRFDYLRVYSLIRTSLDGTPICSIVKDINIKETTRINFIDDNLDNELIDSTTLLFLGGNNFIASTLTQKDNTLFLGDLQNTKVLSDCVEELQSFFDKNRLVNSLCNFELSSEFTEEDRHFKYGETYRIGIQLQDHTGEWSTPIFIEDKKCELRIYYDFETNKIFRPYLKINLSNIDTLNNIFAKYDVFRVRAVMVDSPDTKKSVIAQGLLLPTVFNFQERVNNTGPYSIGSWVARPRNGKFNYEHFFPLGKDEASSNSPECEIQNQINTSLLDVASNKNYLIQFNVDRFLGLPPLNMVFCSIIGSIYETSTSEAPVVDDASIIKLIADISIARVAEGDTDDEAYALLLATIHDEVQKVLPGVILNLTIEDLKTIIASSQNVTQPHIELINNWYSGNYVAKSKTFNANKINGGYTIIEYSGIVGNFTNNNYYIDSSVVTFHSPDIEGKEDLIDNNNLQLRIVGIAKVDSYTNDITLQTSTSGVSPNSGLNKNLWIKNKDVPFINAPVYLDYNWNDTTIGVNEVGYYIYLWNKKGSLIGQTADSLHLKTGSNELIPFDTISAELKHKIIANKADSNITWFLENTSIEYDVIPRVIDSNNVESKYINVLGENKVYQGNYETIVTTNENNSYHIIWNEVYSSKLDAIPTDDNGDLSLLQYDPVSIKFNKPKHLVFSLKIDENSVGVLPVFRSLGEEYGWVQKLLKKYPGGSIPESYPWIKGDYIQFSISEEADVSLSEKPYFYIGELYRNIENPYGGTDITNLSQQPWIPISNDFSTDSNFIECYQGDTYYQKWECLNTIPTTEEDLNSVVDIVSCMLETKINLKGRYDANIESSNLLNVRPSNFNLINPVYSQKNNYFTYNILDDKFNQDNYINQITFSLQKTLNSEIDIWCNINLASSFNLDGLYGKLNKLELLNDTIVAFQDKAISVINFNNRTALSTESGVPIEIANSGKVNGYSVVVNNTGCQNKQSICISSSGIYFIDDLNKTLYNFNKNGITNISSKGMSMWFKNNLTSKEKLFYDSITHDVYVINEDNCITYNEDLQSFVSFMDYNHSDLIFNLSGKSFILDNTAGITPKEMFEGNYTGNYYVQYKINPEPLTDKIFTNLEYIADTIPYNINVDDLGKNSNFPFDSLKVWNEYQEGNTVITDRFKYPNFERKYRIWRLDIPRDENELVHGKALNRIRNPWMYLKLSKTSNHNDKMVFHNLLVKYYR